MTNDWMDVSRARMLAMSRCAIFDRSDDDHFEIDFELGSQAHKEWVRLNGTASS